MNLVLDEQTAVSPEIGSTCSLEDYLALPDHSMDARIAVARAKLGATTILLGHHYQRDEVIRFADATGDSYKLSRIAAETDAKYIVFCGVHFMAESADVLGRDGQQVILPDLNAGCSMADMADIDSVEELDDVFDLADQVQRCVVDVADEGGAIAGAAAGTGNASGVDIGHLNKDEVDTVLLGGLKGVCRNQLRCGGRGEYLLHQGLTIGIRKAEHDDVVRAMVRKRIPCDRKRLRAIVSPLSVSVEL